MTRSTEPTESPRGFDTAVRRRDEDHLNRWPFASEIYNIAIKGPPDWSLRAGVYGEWGTGKTSVLQFIAEMATTDDHVVVWFDPWEFSKKEDLWRSFVLKVIESIESKTGGIVEAGIIRRKVWTSRILRVGPTLLGAWKENAKQAADKGLEFLRNYLSPNRTELQAVRKALAGRKVIILIDDLDRTDAEIVPEILFALKEILDIPGFCFICAFDPVLVGKILRQYHRGFGDGLRFLEKIIDYPRQLPPPTLDGLTTLALKDAKKNCPFVPEQNIRDAVPLLPPNPRAVRQFIRLLALLESQIERHYDHELRWAAIIAANVLKVRHPRIAYALLRNDEFWGKIGMTSRHSRNNDERGEILKTIKEHVDATLQKEGLNLNERERNEVHAVLVELCKNVNIFAGWNSKAMAGQVDIAEAPHAVTRKEFDRFLEVWRHAPNAKTGHEWILSHAKSCGKSERRVYSAIFSDAVESYGEALEQGDSVLREEEKKPWQEKAASLIALLECLLIELGQLNKDAKQVGSTELDVLFQKFDSLAKSNLSVHTQFWLRSESLILKMIESWRGDYLPLIKVTHPYGGPRRHDLNTATAQDFDQRVRSVLLPKFAAQIAESFRKPDFISRVFYGEESSFESRCMLVGVDGPLWKEVRPETLRILAEASTDKTVQANAYQLLQIFGYKMRKENGQGDTVSIEKLLADKQIANAIWNAATATPLSFRGVIDIQDAPDQLKALGIDVQLPPWWKPTLDEWKILQAKPVEPPCVRDDNVEQDV